MELLAIIVTLSFFHVVVTSETTTDSMIMVDQIIKKEHILRVVRGLTLTSSYIKCAEDPECDMVAEDPNDDQIHLFLSKKKLAKDKSHSVDTKARVLVEIPDRQIFTSNLKFQPEKAKRKTVITESIVMGKTSWGDWKPEILCQTRILGFRLRVEKKFAGDNTALNGIQLRCINGTETGQIKGNFGVWGEWKTCAHNKYVDGFNLRSQRNQQDGDDTAANDVKMRCSDGLELNGGGLDWGTWEQSG